MTFRQGEAQSSLSRRPRATHLHLAGGPIARSSPSRCAHGGRRPPASPAGGKKAPSFSPPCFPHRPTPLCPAPAAHRRLVEDDISAAAEGEQPPAPPGDGPAAHPVGAAGDMAEGDGRRHLPRRPRARPHAVPIATTPRRQGAAMLWWRPPLCLSP